MLNCTITSEKDTNHFEKVLSVTAPAYHGQIQILPGHAESFIILQEGEITIEKAKNQKESIQVTNGEIHIKNDTVTVIL